MIEIKRRLEFDAGHRVMNHEGKCKHLHGHRYIVDLYATADHLDALGRIIDFSVLKGIVGKWIDDNLDHKTMLFEEDVKLMAALDAAGHYGDLFITDFNPTAENLAFFLFNKSVVLLADHPVAVTRVVVHETPNCLAEYRP